MDTNQEPTSKDMSIVPSLLTTKMPRPADVVPRIGNMNEEPEGSPDSELAQHVDGTVKNKAKNNDENSKPPSEADDNSKKIRRSTRITQRKRTNKINYKEIEEGKEFAIDEDSIDNAVHKDYEKEVLCKIKKKGDVKLSHPKKSLTAYTLFVKLKRKELQEKFPDATTPELMKEIGRQWKSINEKDKAWYQNMASKDKERYKREMDQMTKLKEFHKLGD